MAGYYDRLRASLGYETPEPEPQGLLQQMQTELGEATRLSATQRFWAFGISVALTAVFWTFASLSIISFNISGFVFMFTLGNLAAVAATCFLVGPAKQYRNMITRERIVSASAFVASMILTIISCIYFTSFFTVFIIVVPCMLVQMAALLWYCSTYIPGGQGLFMRMLGRADIDSVV